SQAQVQLQAVGHANIVLDIGRVLVLADVVHPLGDTDLIVGVSKIRGRRHVAGVSQSHTVSGGAAGTVVQLRGVSLVSHRAGGPLLLRHPVVPVGPQVDAELDFVPAFDL